jgi:2-alkyl-3-oxoalkanoate reductase
MKALVTGGGGFLGGAIVRQLLDRGDHVRVLARGEYPEIAALGAEMVRGDIADATVVNDAVAGCDTVFHVAALPGVWGPYELYYNTNTLGTQNVISACRAHKVPRLVYTSTPSVVHSGGNLEGVDETVPYATHFETAYPETKMLAEKAVLAAHGEGLSTVALRPHLIWGPGDNHLVPRIVDRGRRGKLRHIGTPSPLVDSTYIDDAANAHVMAADALGPDAACGGRAYFVSQGEPWAVDALVNGILSAAKVPPVTKRVSPRVAYAVGAVLEVVFKLFRIKGEPPMTRFVAQQLSTAHWYDISGAERDFGWTPKVTIAEGLTQLGQAFDAEAGGTASGTNA